ncbi:hypothetical protein BDW69DRAFT_164974 [Aspergillus filifer]
MKGVRQLDEALIGNSVKLLEPLAAISMTVLYPFSSLGLLAVIVNTQQAVALSTAMHRGKGN